MRRAAEARITLSPDWDDGLRKCRSRNTRGRPPFGRRGGIGKSGSTRSHNASGSSATDIRVHATSPTRIRLRRFCYTLLGSIEDTSRTVRSGCDPLVLERLLKFMRRARFRALLASAFAALPSAFAFVASAFRRKEADARATTAGSGAGGSNVSPLSSFWCRSGSRATIRLIGPGRSWTVVPSGSAWR
jgi:hypothetical protein